MAAVMNEEIFKKLKEDYIYDNFKLLQDLYNNQLFCDLTLVSKDGMEFKVHKMVVYSASGYFKSLYQSNMKESVADRINLDFISGHILELIIFFIYEAELKTDNAEEIQEVAEKSDYLQFDHLRNICLLLLESSIDDSNCLNLWRLANRLSAEKFGEICIAYILQIAEKLFENSSFLNDLSVDEMKQLLLDSRLPFSQECVFKYSLRWARDDIEMFNKVIDCIRFPLLSKQFLLSDVLTNKLLMQDKTIMEKIIEYATSEWTVETEKDDPSPHNAFLAVLDLEGFQISSSGEILDPQNNTVFPTLYFGCTTFHDNRIFISGGQNSFNGEYTNTCEYYSPETKKFTPFPPSECERAMHECCLIDDKIYSCGGWSSEKTVEIFDLGTAKWTNGPPMLSPRSLFGLTSGNRLLYAIGGTVSKSIEFLDPRSSKGWTTINDAFNSSKFTQCASIGPEIYCFRSENIYIFDTRINKLRILNSGYNEVVKGNPVFLRVCELDGDFGVLLTNENCAELFKYNKKGEVLFKKVLPKSISVYSLCLSTYYQKY